ncbi:structural maintenance of chromosomes protein 5 [Volvox carteri f. nagariensis]|uniref:Structural maintenance of chromosomes protein 5 n=1 Tax=Volvox carteri f. nagariensis TaxID=3068 RepID=D8TJ96_VOLCA|nr:structural maintenance of chromosomes protein 5 [Volvox carteri f. nagariensis]EFJ52501.1 structural maintenance of chromosomes protein 5 [Volvox carteri f. nagariensis]|eukprot:XP_002946574.1 structural maintenance of chromosomes protein 5 [Volvox carteri f. nagariensis]
MFFAKGAVKLVKVHDFMTYNGTVTILPGPRLNLVLGPNGMTLGRADDIKAFVRRGMHSFWTEITLSSGGEGRDYVVKRTVTVRVDREPNGERKERSESKWKINGVDATAKEVDKLIKRLNIQFGNLCQFLPQDKVAEFAKMDQYELLGATLMAVGDASLHEQHQLLINLRKEERQEIADLNTTTERLQKLQAEHDRQRRDYERFQKREKLMEEARSFLSKAKWLDVIAKSRTADEAKKRWVEKRDARRALEGKQEEQIRPIRDREEALKDIRQKKTSAERLAKEADAHMRRLADKLNKQDSEIASLADELSSLDQQTKERADQITAARMRLERAQAELAKAPDRPPQELVNRAHELRSLIQGSLSESSEVEAQQNTLTLQIQSHQAQIGRVRGRLDLLNSRKHQMLQRLGQEHRNIGVLHHFIEQHRTDGTFQGPVFGPLALEISVRAAPGMPNSVALQYVENSCWPWLGSYIVTNKHDEKLLNDEARRNGVSPTVKIVCSSYNPNVPFHVEHPAGTASQHAGYGILHTLDELIEAAPVFMHLVVKQCNANYIYIGTSQTLTAMEALSQETPIRTVLVGNTRLSIIRSRYNAAVRPIENGDLKPPRLLGSGGGSEEDTERAELQREESALAQERDRLLAEAEQLGQQLQQHEQKRQAWQAEIKRLEAQYQAIQRKRTDLMAAVANAQRTLRNKEAVPDPELRRPEIRRGIHEKITHLASLSQQVLAAAQDLWMHMRKFQALELRFYEATAQLNALKASRDKREKELQAARNAAHTAEEALKSAKSDLKCTMDNATENYPLSEADKEEVKRLAAEGVQPSALREASEAKAAEAEQVVCNNQNVANEFRKRQAEITHLTEKMKQHEERCQQLRGSIEDAQSLWLPEIRNMVSTINASFSNNFKEIGCAGEVRLHEDEDFEKFAIQILVQFRVQEDMQLLTGTRQSGGERSVSTILYLIALQSQSLQGVTATPFRVVDEINQGMDPINERKVYKQLVAASTEEHTPQCFLLTPKLLSGLEYTSDIHTHIIYSSAEMEAGLPTTFTTADICG